MKLGCNLVVVIVLLNISQAGMFAIRAERDYVVEEDFMKAVRVTLSCACFKSCFLVTLSCHAFLSCCVCRRQVRKVAENKKLEGKLEYSKV